MKTELIDALAPALAELTAALSRADHLAAVGRMGAHARRRAGRARKN